MAHFLRKVMGNVAPLGARLMSAGTPPRKVAVVGAGGGIGQPLGMLMKLNPAVTELSLYDVMGTPGVAADVGHINTAAKTKGYMGDDQIDEALAGCDLVIIPAGVPRKPGMTRDDLFAINGGIVRGIVEACGRNCPNAWIAMISNPVNSTVPIAAETLKKMGVYNPATLFGVTTLDVVRAKTFYAEKKGLDVTVTTVPVVGGHAGITILPLFSQAEPLATLTDEERDALTKRTMDGGTEVVAAKAGKGSATLSMAYAGAVFGDACLRAMNGATDVTECTYVESSVVEGVPYFSSKVTLGKGGVDKIGEVGPVNDYEAQCLKDMIPDLSEQIQKGVDFVAKA